MSEESLEREFRDQMRADINGIRKDVSRLTSELVDFRAESRARVAIFGAVWGTASAVIVSAIGIILSKIIK